MGTVIKVRVGDGKTDKVLDLKNIALTGLYGVWLDVAPDDSPIVLRNAGTQDVYSLDWEEP